MPVTNAESVTWWHAIRRYLVILALGNLLWEALQMPLYTLWYEGTVRQIVLYGLHCTGGDILIGLSALMGALLVLGRPQWPGQKYRPVALAAILIGVTYTVFSEWYNVYVANGWAYASLMPQILGIGLSPIAQWIVIPALGFRWARKAGRR